MSEGGGAVVRNKTLEKKILHFLSAKGCSFKLFSVQKQGLGDLMNWIAQDVRGSPHEQMMLFCIILSVLLYQPAISL